MIDIALREDCNGLMDIIFTEIGPREDSSLNTAILLSLFCDKRADSEEISFLGSDPRGYWGDHIHEKESFRTGSKLWLLSREKNTPEVNAEIVAYCRESLQWLLDEGFAESIAVSVNHKSECATVRIEIDGQKNTISLRSSNGI